MRKSSLIWLTRPKADSDSLATELAKRGIESIVAPVIRIKPEMPIFANYTAPAAILLTSRHAAHILMTAPTSWHSLPVYCVGAATANAARAQGYTNCFSGTLDAISLLPRIANDLPFGSRLLYLSGDETRSNIANLLGIHGITVETQIAYHAIAQNELPEELHTALIAGEVDAVAFFSTRSAELACELMTRHHLHVTAPKIEAYCFSLSVAQAAAALPWKRLVTCHRPTRAAMVDLVVSELSKT